MNLILLHPEDFINCSRVVLKGRRFVHIKTVHRAAIGDSLEVGLVDGNLGVGEIVDMSDGSVELSVDLKTDAPEPLPITMILALPRPKMLKRILINAVSMGVKRIVLLNSYRVEKSFWLSPVLQPEGLNELIE